MDAVDILFEHAACGYLACDTDGTIARANRTIADWLGCEPGALHGRRFQSLLAPGAAIFYETQFAPALDLHGIVREVAFDFLRHDGSRLAVLVTATRQSATDRSSPLNWVTVFNASDRRRYEENLLRARQESERVALELQALNETLEQRIADEVAARLKTEDALRQSQKIEAIGQLTGGLAHDFNNLLTSITGNLELLNLRINQDRLQDLGRYVTAAQGASNRAAALTHRLLAFSRRQTLDPKATDVDRLVRALEGLLRSTVGGFVSIEILGSGAVWTTLIDANQLESALLNLCINARDAMPDGGAITIELTNSARSKGSPADQVPQGEYAVIAVTDTGTGMSSEVVERAFDPFFTTKPMGQGTGLGLSMVHGFVRQSGGQVRIDSVEGRGTTILLYLPRHQGIGDQEDTTPDQAVPSPDGDGQTVLIVDDEPAILALIVEVLEELGYQAIVEADSAAALVLLQSKIRIDLLVTDVGLPGGMNGRQLADAGRALRPGLGILFVTGYAENAIAQNGVMDDRMQVLTKPFRIDALADRIKSMIGSR